MLEAAAEVSARCASLEVELEKERERAGLQEEAEASMGDAVIGMKARLEKAEEDLEAATGQRPPASWQRGCWS